jgi:hypothetical protein
VYVRYVYISCLRIGEGKKEKGGFIWVYDTHKWFSWYALKFNELVSSWGESKPAKVTNHMLCYVMIYLMDILSYIYI